MSMSSSDTSSERISRSSAGGCRGGGCGGGPRLGPAGEELEALEAGGDHGDADLVAHRVVDDGAEDDVGALVGGLG